MTLDEAMAIYTAMNGVEGDNGGIYSKKNVPGTPNVYPIPNSMTGAPFEMAHPLDGVARIPAPSFNDSTQNPEGSQDTYYLKKRLPYLLMQKTPGWRT